MEENKLIEAGDQFGFIIQIIEKKDKYWIRFFHNREGTQDHWRPITEKMKNTLLNMEIEDFENYVTRKYIMP